MRRLSELRDTVKTWRDLERNAQALDELVELSLSEDTPPVRAQLTADIASLEARLKKEEQILAYSGPYDARPAIVGIHAGAGGTESQDWAQMLLRMYVRWAERKGLSADVLDISQGEEAGVKSALLEVRGRYAYGQLKAEKGSHRLVRLSPFDADHARHTSFALVEVMPEADEVEVKVNPDDLRIDYFRASGAGGQNVQKNSTAIRIVHVPTGITVAVQNERSQRQNRDAAMTILTARLMQLEIGKQAEATAKLKGEHVAAQFGSRIRSYVLHPYKQIKDHRTGYERTDPDIVLDGDIDGFIQAYLMGQVGNDDGSE